MSGVSGFPSSQKTVLGPGITNNFVTVVPTDPYRNALETQRFAFRVGSDSVPRVAGAATGIEKTEDGNVFVIEDAGNLARRGDFIRFENGPAQFIEFPVAKVEPGKIYITCVPLDAPVSGNEFYILRSVTQRTSDSGAQLVTFVPTVYNPVLIAKLKTSVDQITDAAYTELIAATVDPIAEIEIFNKTGMVLILAVGAPGTEEDLVYIGSDGLSRQSLSIPPGSRISLKSVEGTAQDGLVLLNAFG